MFTAIVLALALAPNPRVDYVVQKLVNLNVPRNAAESYFRDPRIALASVPPPTMGWEEFISAKLMTGKSIEHGVRFRETNLPVLRWVEARFGIERNFMTALPRLESDLGDNLGSGAAFNICYTRLVKAASEKAWKAAAAHLAALACYAWKLGRDPFLIPSSRACAIGLVQFLPDTLSRYAVDGNGDGRIDLFDPWDALPSGANYLVRLGWHRDRTESLRRYVGAMPGTKTARFYPLAFQKYAEAIRNRQLVSGGD